MLSMIRSIDIWVEREKDSVVVEKINISKKQPELNERRRNYALKIIISGYFAFFLELNFYFYHIFIIYIYISSFCTTFSGTHMRTVPTGSYPPG